MSGANHIVGGTVFTGIFASFWNLNIFERPALLFFTAFFAILADIDHLKSPIGKLFYPIAKWLDRRYGHRTITHSIACYLTLLMFVSLVERSFGGNGDITLVCAFAYFSHLLFDMLTKQGVPLFYPFKKNACVIPANPELRFRSSDLKTESMIFFVFCLLGFSCQNLFANGFWNTYNNQYSNIKHIHSETQLSPQLITVNYDFTDEFGKNKKGSGIVIKSTESECVLIDSTNFIEINKTHKINELNLIRNDKKKALNELFFYNISADSLNKLIKGKALINIKLQTKNSIKYIEKNQIKNSQNVTLDYVFNPTFTFEIDTTKKDILKKIELLNHELLQLKISESKLRASETQVNNRIAEINRKWAEMGVYERENATKEFAKLKQEKERIAELENPNSGKILIQLKHLNEELKKENISINGYISWIIIS
jgi:inner membrane protein